MTLKRVLVTGAAGRIGTAFTQRAGDRFDLYLADRRDSLVNDSTRHIRGLDVVDFDACLAACEGMDAVLHLAADPSPTAEFESLLANNIVGTHNVFRAAAQQACERVVIASSAHAVGGYEKDLQITESMAPRPTNLYGATKVFGEALASCFAASHAMCCIAVRIANVSVFKPGQVHSARDIAGFISERDVVHLLERALMADVSGFHIINGVSDNRFKLLALDETRQLIGYTPQDDSFELLGYPAIHMPGEPD